MTYLLSLVTFFLGAASEEPSGGTSGEVRVLSSSDWNSTAPTRRMARFGRQQTGYASFLQEDAYERRL
jgi:hypothetical protein